MANYTENLNLEKPLQSEGYDVDVFNANADKIDSFAGLTPPRALTADTLTTARKINGVSFKGNADIVTGAGFYHDDVTYSEGDLAFIYNSNNNLELHKSLQNGNIGHSPLTTTGYWEKQDLGGNSYEIGDLIWRPLPTKDSGKHLLDGTRLSGDGIYKGFVDYIAELYENNPTANYFTDETTWQASITQYGVCGKFVYDSTLNTVRLPKITGIIEGTIDVSTLGDLVEAGLPNITGTFGSYRFGDGRAFVTGAFYDNGRKYNTIAQQETGTSAEFGFDASLSSSIYGNSTTVQPQTIKGFVYIIIATSTKTDIEVDIDEIATDLNGKADTDFSNVNNTAKITMSGMGMPSSSYKNLSLPSSGANITAPADGWFYFAKKATAEHQYVRLTTNTISTIAIAVGSGNGLQVFLPVKSGDSCNIGYSANGTTDSFRFVYAEGSKSLNT